MIGRARVQLALVVCVGLAAACSDNTGPRRLAGATPLDTLPGLIVSQPVGSAGAAAAGALGAQRIVAAGSSVAYVSLPPGTVPTGLLATIRDRANGQSVTAAVVDGGFDPVAIPASVGDTLGVDVTRSGSAGPLHAVEPVRAHRPPEVVRTSPPNGGRDVPLNASIIVVFSDPIDSSSLVAGAVKLQAGIAVAGTLSFGDPQHLTALFIPAAPLAAGTTYGLEVSGGIKDLGGDSIGSPVRVAFTTVASADAQSRIAFTGYGSGNGAIYTMNADGSDVRLVVADVGSFGTQEPAWSPDGTRLAFVSRRHAALGDLSDIDPAIYVANADGSGVTRLTHGGSAATPAWSPDGKKIAFSAGWLYVMNADGSGVTSVTNDDARDPTWSPDGAKIAFILTGGPSSELYVAAADGSGLRHLVPDRSPGSVAWSPSGTSIAFEANGDIYVTDADGYQETRLTNDALNSSPTWSPDGTRIAFVSSRTGTSQIYVMNADGSGVTGLTSDLNIGRDLDWSRSGRMPVPPTGALSIEKASTASGDNQTDTVRATLASPLRVRVLQNGAPAAGVTVWWSVGVGGGSVSAAATVTDADGIASVFRTLGDTAGSPIFGETIARVLGATGSPVVFSTTARPGHAVRLYVPFFDSAGIGVVNAAMRPVRVYALDASGNPVTGVRIVWTVTAGGGSITPADPYLNPGQSSLDTTANVGNPGTAWAQFTLGPNEGVQSFTATAPSLPGALAAYNVTAVTALVQVGNVDAYGDYTVDFSPDSVAVPSGRTVGFFWSYDLDPAPNVHNVTFDDDPRQPTSSPALGAGGFFTRTFTGGPRTIRYRCTLHGETGTVTVLP